MAGDDLGSIKRCLRSVAPRLVHAVHETSDLTLRHREAGRLRAAQESELGDKRDDDAMAGFAAAERAEHALLISVRTSAQRLRSLELVVAACVGEAARITAGARTLYGPTAVSTRPPTSDAGVRGAWAPPGIDQRRRRTFAADG